MGRGRGGGFDGLRRWLDVLAEQNRYGRNCHQYEDRDFYHSQNQFVVGLPAVRGLHECFSLRVSATLSASLSINQALLSLASSLAGLPTPPRDGLQKPY